MSVATSPGATRLTRTPWARSSRAMTTAADSSADLAAAYGAVPGGKSSTTALDTKTRQPWAARNEGIAAAASSMLDNTCNWNIWRYSSGEDSTVDRPRDAAPALPTTTDTGPQEAS